MLDENRIGPAGGAVDWLNRNLAFPLVLADLAGLTQTEKGDWIVDDGRSDE